MAVKVVRLLLSACTIALFGASLCIALIPETARANRVVAGNPVYNLQGKQIGCVTVSPPFTCYWNN